MSPYPLLFHPILKPKVWGGQRLASLGKRLPVGVRVGESWELADLPDSVPEGRSIIANGELAGRTLRQAIETHPGEILGDAALTSEGGFPVLIKYLDARENLSVQVHPDQRYVLKHPDAHLKSEAWEVIQAEPGAVIYKGVKPHVTAEQFAGHIRDGTVVDDLIAVPVQAGDFHYLPSGTCHALGAGIVVAEIQTPSDTTFRVYDWGRGGPNRDLHVQQALECIRFGHAPQEPHKPHSPIEARGLRTTPLLLTEYFHIERIDALTMARFPIVTSNLPLVWMMISGSARIETSGASPVDLHPGTTVLLPAGLSNSLATLGRGSLMLEVRLPSPLKGMIA